MPFASRLPKRFFVRLDDGSEAGPLDAERLKRLAIAGVIHRKSPLRIDDGEWLPSGRIRDLFNPTVSPDEFAHPAARPGHSESPVEIPSKIATRADNLVRDARLAVLTGFIPLLGLIFILRLVQWHRLARESPSLNNPRGTKRERDFHAARSRFWFAILFWPGVFIMIAAFVAYAALTT